MDDLARLAALHGIATAYQPAADVTVQVPEATVKAVLGLLGVVTAAPGDIRAEADGAEREEAVRLLPPTLVHWQGIPPRPPWPGCRPGPGSGWSWRTPGPACRGVPLCPSEFTGWPPRRPTGAPPKPP